MLSMECFGFIFILAITSSLGDVQFHRNSAEFATNLYQKSIIGQNNKNIILSPLSIQTAVGLAFMGAHGTTAQEMVDGLRLGSTNKSNVSEYFKDHLSIQNNNRDVSIANKIYIKSGYKMDHSFQQIAETKFNSETENLDFSKTQESAGIINNWVENKTNHKIKDLIAPDSLDSSILMVLVNAIYFQGSWKNRFSEYVTSERAFWISKDVSVNTKSMSAAMIVPSKYSDVLKATAIKLPYQTAGLFMMIILPDNKDGLTYLENNLNQINLLDFAENMENVDYDNVIIPKFKIEFSTILNDILAQMGMSTMFSNSADFTGILESHERLYISEAIHKAFIDVNENGTVAGAATGLRAYPICFGCRPPPKNFIADHPFFFTIMNENGILFAGRYVKPE